MTQQFITGGLGSEPGKIGYFVLDGLSPLGAAIALTATLTAASSTTAADVLIARSLAATLTGVSDTAAVDIAVARSLAATLTGASDTAADVLIARSLVAR